jgi:hypothetical protein
MNWLGMTALANERSRAEKQQDRDRHDEQATADKTKAVTDRVIISYVHSAKGANPCSRAMRTFPVR